MKTFAITAAALVCALATVLSTRLLIPALIVIYRAIEAGFAPAEPELAVAGAPTVVVTDAAPAKQAAPKKATVRKTRSRRATSKTTATATNE